MEKQLIARGVLAGAFAGLVTFVFTRIFAEPLIQTAIDYESARDAVQDRLDRAAGTATPAAAPELFSRTVQANVGTGAALILFGAAMGALVAVTYVVCLGRTGRIWPFQLGLLVPAFGFLGIFWVPFLKYPANPPAIGHEDTIRERGFLYLVTVLCSCGFLFLAVLVGQLLHRRCSSYASSVIAGAGYVVAMGIVFAALPSLGHLHDNVVAFGRHATETPLPLEDEGGTLVFPGFPADVLAQFRMYAVLAQLLLWGVLALTFAPLAERVLDPRSARRRRTARAARAEERLTA